MNQIGRVISISLWATVFFPGALIGLIAGIAHEGFDFGYQQSRCLTKWITREAPHV